MNHICGICRKVMEKSKRSLEVPLYHMKEISNGQQVKRETITDGTTKKPTTCYICPNCKFVVFYGDNFKYGKTEYVTEAK